MTLPINGPEEGYLKRLHSYAILGLWVINPFYPFLFVGQDDYKDTQVSERSEFKRLDTIGFEKKPIRVAAPSFGEHLLI